MTKELLEKRLKEIEASLDQTIAQANMLDGAARECRHWIKILESENFKPSENKDPIDIKQAKRS